MKVYLASPFFNEEESEVKRTVKRRLVELGYDVHDPQNPASDSSGWETPNSAWAQRIFRKDVEAVDACELVVAIDWGLYGDCGTAWEIGYAYARGRKILVVVPDAALGRKHSLMVANGCDNFVALSRFLSADDAVSAFLDPQKSCFLYGVVQQ